MIEGDGKLPKLSIVVPCYNESEVLRETSSRLLAELMQMISTGMISDASQCVFVDDGSVDTTWSIIDELASASRHFAGIKLSRNMGHQNALLAGLENATGEILVSIDADLQDDVAMIEKMVKKSIEGADIVYAVRKRRETDSYFKRVTAQSYYWVLGKLGVNIVYNHADYRLMSRKAIESLRQYEEVNLFLRGIVPTIGYLK